MKSILTFSILSISVLASAQTAEQREVIKSSMKKTSINEDNNYFRKYASEKESQIVDYLKNNPTIAKTFFKDGKVYSLYYVTQDGVPIYITTKDIGQVNNSKANALYSGGNIGVSITGTNMVAGVWDGGQVNASHISLVGQSTMQANQTLSSDTGNDHQTAVSGIMVGKNINNAQGIAYNATTQNYDWDNDLEEMNTFSNNGFLVSNHSYGYSNDNTTPAWTFGAYDEQSKAWDAMLKAKPFYLPFVASGNEQQSSGNASAQGFDIITGSSSSKNVMTIGATNIDNTMSDYSNWGPTDDGRVKPDLVTLGTSIDVPLYGSNSGYTGNITSSSGTSYSSPAAAAGALLLQQYYYSLNNSYMKASMLKALLLHSADDDASGNGPDAKFGWGILNLEKAANIIKQNSAADGTSRMIMISNNPSNDGIAELVNNFTFGSDGARASLAWVDDDGIAQTSEDGINNTTSRLVYNFSMKLEQTSPALTAFPYNNLSIANPSMNATVGNDWFQSANNYIQANLSGTTDNANGKVIIRKSTASPAMVRELALIVSGLKTNTVGIDDYERKENVVFFDRTNSKVRLISNHEKVINDYQIYSIDGRLISSGNANSNEIDFNYHSKNIFIFKCTINTDVVLLKFMN